MPNRNLNQINSSAIPELNKKQFALFENSQEVSGSIKAFYLDLSMPLYGMSPQQYIEGTKYHNECFHKLHSVPSLIGYQ